MTRDRRPSRRTHEGAFAAAMRRNDWERVALYLLLGVAEAARNAPPGTIDDVIALLAGEPEACDERA